jgi:hypothetical protein
MHCNCNPSICLVQEASVCSTIMHLRYHA